MYAIDRHDYDWQSLSKFTKDMPSLGFLSFGLVSPGSASEEPMGTDTDVWLSLSFEFFADLIWIVDLHALHCLFPYISMFAWVEYGWHLHEWFIWGSGQGPSIWPGLQTIMAKPIPHSCPRCEMMIQVLMKKSGWWFQTCYFPRYWE